MLCNCLLLAMGWFIYHLYREQLFPCREFIHYQGYKVKYSLLLDGILTTPSAYILLINLTMPKTCASRFWILIFQHC